MTKWRTFLASAKTDTGLLLLRLGIGLQLSFHGWPKITGGPEKWVKLGKNMSLLGLDFAHTFWGFMAAFSEFGGGILLILGLFTRPAALLAAFTMFIAYLHHWVEVYPDEKMSLLKKWMEGGNALELMIVFIALYFTGPGKFSLDRKYFN